MKYLIHDIVACFSKLMPIGKHKRRRFKYGTLRGKAKLTPDFDEPLPEEILKAFEQKTKETL